MRSTISNMTSRAFILLLLLAALAQSAVAAAAAAAQQHQHDQAISTASSSSSSTSPLLSLLILCLIMTISTFFMGALPLFINLSHLQMILLQSLAAGLLLGAGITIVLPEGVANLYAHKPHSSNSSSSSKSKHSEYDPEHALGISVLVGFLLMYFVDRIFSSQHHHFQHHPHSSQSHQQHQQPPPTSSSSSSAAASSSSSAGTPLRIAGFRLFFRGMSRTGSHEDGSLAGFSRASLTSLLGLVIHAFTDGIAMGATSLTSAAQLQQQVDATTSPTTLHVRHSDMAAQDSSDPASSLRLIVFLAIMLHKAPAALGLSTLLLSQGGSRLAILRAVALFALSTPIGALVTYGLGYWVLENGVVAAAAAAAGGGGTGPINGGTIPPLDSRLVVRVASSLLAVTSRDAGGHGNDDHGAAAPPPPGGLSSKHIGIALTFSAGTFLYVAMHALGELMGGTPHPRPASSSEQGHHLRSRHSQQQRQGRQQHTGYDSVRGHDDDDDEQDGAGVDDEERRRRRWKRYDEEDPAIFDVEHEHGGGGGGGNNKREPHNPPSSSSSSVMGETKPRTRITSGGDHHHAAINASSDSSESPPPGRNARSGPEHERDSGKTPLGLELVKTALLLIGTATPRFLQGLTGGHGH